MIDALLSGSGGPALETLIRGGAVALLAIGLFGLVSARHLARVPLALTVAAAGANLLIATLGDRGAPDAHPATLVAGAIDPLTQTLALTGILLGGVAQVLAIVMLIRVQRHYGSLDRRALQRMLDAELAVASVPAPAPARADAG